MRWHRRLVGLTAATVLASAGLLAAGPGSAQADPVAANTPTPIGVKPLMGFNNWARFTCAAQARLDGTRDGYSFQQFMQDQAKAMSDTGLVAAGYTNLTVDDCWMQRTGAGYLHGAAAWGGTSQPGFDWELTDYAAYLHGLGMQAGLYSTSGVNTCQGVPGGVMGHEQADANSLAYWGIDSIKLDNCGTDSTNRQGEFTTFANALNTATAGTGRKILFNESAPAGYGPASAEKYNTMDWVRTLGQMWRVSPDIAVWHPSTTSAWDWPHGGDYYEGGVYQNFTDAVALARYNAPGNANDADMLLIGDNNQLTLPEQRSQFALWSAMGSPLMISTDVRKMAADPVTYAPQLGILKNADIIAVDQDALGAGGYLASRGNASATAGIDVVVKPLAGGKRAVVVLNKNATATTYTLDLGRVGFSNLTCTRTARDLWSHTSTGVQGSITATIGAHDNAMYTIDPGSCGAAAPTGMIQSAQPGFQATPFCLDAYGGATTGAKVALYGCTGNSNQQWTRRADGLIASYQNAGLCVSGDSTGLRLAACATGDPKQVWTYHRDGRLTQAGGVCMDIFGGSLTDSAATVGTYACGSHQPNQTWSAPFDAPPAA
ncbi:ricin-type beta-trefoil lectin domain protein [Kitasatospora paracochleata]|uniref:Alpha-galactosidase n=1 Tax=Kitasatospora paracochleata TaxID=58354 RepID=A0ABT1JAS3_9ACTN|nr:ricin-type beta-trefoil lectin domain protein [Kitasatospora paracochleata]MCP2313766.1 alpha-galactosidase [Kitasatospora paracochleata]